MRQKLNLNEVFDFKNYPSSEREINEIEETLQELYDKKYFENKNKIENVSSDYSKININLY